MSSLEKVHPLAYPWQQDLPSITRAAEKRRDKDTQVAQPDSIISELTLGFWADLLKPSPANEELWRHHLRHAFPNSPGTRAAVHKAVADMRTLRNRCAHQDSLLEVDTRIEVKKLLSLVEWIDLDARRWIESIETVSTTAGARPIQPPRDVVVVAARTDVAIAMYDRVCAYVCPSEWSFAPIKHIGFYCDKRIEPYFPAVEEVVVPTRWSSDEQKILSSSVDPIDQRVAKIMGYGLKNGWKSGDQFQVFLLSKKLSPDTLRKPQDAPIVHKKTGRGSAFVQHKRYFPHSALMAADDTEHLS